MKNAYALLILAYLFSCLNGMKEDMKEITLPKDENVKHRRIICNEDCDRALIINYSKSTPQLLGEHYFRHTGNINVYDVKKQEILTTYSIGNHVPLVVKFIKNEPVAVLFDEEYDVLKFHNFKNDSWPTTLYTLESDETISPHLSTHTMSNGIKAITIIKTDKKSGELSGKILILDAYNNIKSFDSKNTSYDMSISHDGAYLLLGMLNKSELWDISQEPKKIRDILNHCEFSLNSPTYDFFNYGGNILYSCKDELYSKFDTPLNVLTFSKNYYISSKISNDKTKFYLNNRDSQKEPIKILTLKKPCLYNYCIKISKKEDLIVIYPIGNEKCFNRYYIGALKNNSINNL